MKQWPSFASRSPPFFSKYFDNKLTRSPGIQEFQWVCLYLRIEKGLRVGLGTLSYSRENESALLLSNSLGSVRSSRPDPSDPASQSRNFGGHQMARKIFLKLKPRKAWKPLFIDLFYMRREVLVRFTAYSWPDASFFVLVVIAIAQLPELSVERGKISNCVCAV